MPKRRRSFSPEFKAEVVDLVKLASTVGQPRGQIIDAVSIRERPPEVEDRAIPGHWEGDLITGTNNTHIATLVERKTRFTLLAKVLGKDTSSVVTALSCQVRKLPIELRKSLTWDRGGEMASHKKFTIATDVRFTSVTRGAHGSVVPTKTPTGCCANIFQTEQTCRSIPNAI